MPGKGEQGALGRQGALRTGVSGPKDTITSSLLCMAQTLLSLFPAFEVNKPNDRCIRKHMSLNIGGLPLFF